MYTEELQKLHFSKRKFLIYFLPPVHCALYREREVVCDVKNKLI